MNEYYILTTMFAMLNKIYFLSINTVEYLHYILILDKSESRRKSSWGADLTISATLYLVISHQTPKSKI